MVPNVGWGELIVIALLALIVFGPNKLPEMMKSLGKALRGFQEESSRAFDQLRSATDVETTEHGVIDHPDVSPAPEDVVLYNRNPEGLMPGQPEPAPRAHAPRKRSSAPAKKSSARKTPSRKAATARKSAQKRTTNGRSAGLEAHEDT